MDIQAKVAALEEEVTVLKGEIKMILQEVRTAILARENPFALASTESLTLPASMREERGPSIDRGAAASLPAIEPAPAPVIEPTPIRTVAPKPAPVIVPAEVAAAAPPRLDVPKLAALVSWTQETAQRHTSADLTIVLSLARYSGLIEADLEATLGKIGRTVATPSDKIRAGIGDLLLALRQLEAIIGTPGKDASPVYKAG